MSHKCRSKLNVVELEYNIHFLLIPVEIIVTTLPQRCDEYLLSRRNQQSSFWPVIALSCNANILIQISCTWKLCAKIFLPTNITAFIFVFGLRSSELCQTSLWHETRFTLTFDLVWWKNFNWFWACSWKIDLISKKLKHRRRNVVERRVPPKRWARLSDQIDSLKRFQNHDLKKIHWLKNGTNPVGEYCSNDATAASAASAQSMTSYLATIPR